ncbi:HlyD family secretion protein [Chloroflexota bacterium]
MKTKHNILILLILSLALAGCGVISPPEATPTPTTIPQDASDSPGRKSSDIVASGEVIPIRTLDLSFEYTGRVDSVEIAEDEDVVRDQLLAQLEMQPALEAAVIAAELDEGQILEAAVFVAELEVLVAQQALDALEENNSLAQAAAFQEIVDANQVIGDTQYRLYNLTIPAAFAGMETRDALKIAAEKLDAARQAYEPYKFKSSSDQTRQDLKEAVEFARSDFNAILRLIELEATLKTAYANLARADEKYETLSQGPDPDEVALAQARLRNAEAQVDVAHEAAEAHQVNAAAQLDVARAALESIYLYAPINGTAISVDVLPGETVVAGAPVITVADLSELRVETTDLSERDVAQVAVGQKVSVYIEALNIDVPGSVARISPQANVVGGDVVYTVLVVLDEQPDGLRWGMTVEVTIETE